MNKTGNAVNRHALMQRRRPRGFTLIELMITVAIVAILARVALPSYLDYVKRGKLAEGFNGLTSCSLALGQFYQDNRSWATASVGAATTDQCPGTSTNFTYTLPTKTATGYVLTATGNSGGPVAGFVFTLDNTGARATTGAPSGWSTSTSCWVNSRSGSCQ